MAADLRSIFFTYAPVLILIPFYLALKAKGGHKELKAILYYILLSILTQLASFALWFFNINNLPILHLYTILEFLIIFRLYYILLKNDIPYPVFLMLSGGFCLFSVLDSLFIESIFTFNTISRSVESFLFIILSVLWFFKSITGEQETGSKGTHYLVAGFFIYFSGAIVLFSFSNYINRLAYTLLLNIWSIHTLLLVFLYVTMSVGLLKYKKA